MIPALVVVGILVAHWDNPHVYWWAAVIACAAFHGLVAFEAWVGPPKVAPG